ncbi:MAG TPA: thioesterase family protein [Bacillales bacterium]|nr:thioesterase family protein [Bacillales bacterium]
MEHRTSLKVRFAETDLLGHVNNNSYFIYLEQGRVGLFESVEPEATEGGWHFILASIKCDFLKQAFFNQKLSVVTKVGKIGNKSFRLVQTILDEETREKVAESESAIIYFQFDTQKSEPIPSALREKLERYLVEDD